MAAPPLAFLPDLLEIHFGELQTLWARRRDALRSPAHTLRTLRLLDERIAAHTQGLLAVDPRATRALVEPALAGDSRDAACAAAHVLLRLGDAEAARLVARAVARADAYTDGRAAPGLAEALVHGPAAAVEPLYAALAAEGAPAAMAVATEVLAARGALRGGQADAALATLVGDDAPAVRAAGWRAAAQLGARRPPAEYAAGWQDDAPAVRLAALEAAAWAGEPAVLDYARAAAARTPPGPLDALRLLAELADAGDGADAERVAAVAVAAATAAPGARPAHVALLGTLGSPEAVPWLVARTADADPRTAAAAGRAFARLTGVAVDRPDAYVPLPGDLDPFDAEFADAVPLPDPARAAAVWAGFPATLREAPRLAAGVDVSGPPDAAGLEAVDLDARRAWCMRARFRGRWAGTPAALGRLTGDGDALSPSAWLPRCPA